MSRKIGSNKTTTSYWSSVISSVGHPKYAPSTIFEEGPEYAKGSRDDSSAVFNKACAFELEKVFNPRLDVYDSVGQSIAAQITNVLLDRVGRNRSYTAADMDKYLAEAGVRYALLSMIKNALTVAERVPREAQLLTNRQEWKDIYESYYNSVNTNFPIPEHLAKYIDEYVVGIYEDKDDSFNKGLVLFVNVLEFWSTITKQTREVKVIGGNALHPNIARQYLDETPTKEMISIARDIASFVKTKELTELSNVTIYPLDAKHRVTIINMAKFNVLNTNSPAEAPEAQNGDDFYGAGPAPTCEYVPGGSIRYVKDAKADNINYWDSIGMAEPCSRDVETLQNLRCIQGIDGITLRVHDASDEDRYKGSLAIGLFGSNNESDWIDEAQGIIAYVDLFGGFSLLSGVPGDIVNNNYIFEMTTEAFGTESVTLTGKNLDSIKLIALQEVFNIMIAQKENEENDK